MEKRLSQMQPGESGIVRKVVGSGNIKFRLIDMGIVSGARVHVVKYAPLGDPMEIKVKGFTVSLRIAEADMILIDVKGEDA